MQVEHDAQWDESFRCEDTSTWFEVEGITKTDCCEGGLLPLVSGGFIECPIHATEIRFN